jgi:hypothetical protein
MNFTAAIINLIDHLPWMQGAPSDGVEDQPRGDHPGTTFLDDPQRGPAAKSQWLSKGVLALTNRLTSNKMVPEMRQRIWEEYRQKRRDKNNTPSANKVHKSDTAHSRQHNSPPNQHNHGNVASLKTDAAIAPATCDFTEYSMTSKRPERANAVRHKGTKAEWRTTVHSHDQKPPTPIEPPRPPTQERSELVISVTEWLIDSGATAHMTPSKEDFNGTLTPFDSIVETANGGIIRITHIGTVRILMCDIFRPDNTIVVKLHNVLVVPGLTKSYYPSPSGTPAIDRSTI